MPLSVCRLIFSWALVNLDFFLFFGKAIIEEIAGNKQLYKFKVGTAAILDNQDEIH